MRLPRGGAEAIMACSMEALIDLLQKNALTPREDIARMLDMTVDQVEAEISRLEREGVILGYQTIINREKWDTDIVTAVIEVKITPERDGGFDRIASRIAKFEEVQTCYLMSGGYDLLIIVEAAESSRCRCLRRRKIKHHRGRAGDGDALPAQDLQRKRRLPSFRPRARAPGRFAMSIQIADHVRDIPRSGIRDFFEIVQSMDDVISLGIGEPDFATPWHIREAAIYSLEKGRTGYTSNLGLPRLRRAISSYVEDHFGVHYEPLSEVLVSVGVSEAIDIALRAILNPGDEVLYHEPCYVSYSPERRSRARRGSRHSDEGRRPLRASC